MEELGMLEMSVNGLVERKDYSKIRANIDIPDLIGIQKRSYEQFLQLETDPDRR
jgi:DNA-directed RNA polymerase subunit beta